MPSEDIGPLNEPCGSYRLIGILGSGRTGEVFLAEDRESGDQFAIKRFHPTEDQDSRSRLRRAARLAASLEHPAIVRVFDVFTVDGADHLVMEHVSGPSLAEQLRDHGPLSLKRAFRIGRRIAAALAAAHERGIVHRDLKTENVLLTQDGYPKIVDFAIASAVASDGNGVLPPARNSSPEQALGQTADARSDLFALGVLLYEILSGVSPFAAPSPEEMRERVISHSPEDIGTLRPEVPGNIAGLIADLLNKKRTERPHKAADVVRRLDMAADPGESLKSIFRRSGLLPPERVVEIGRDLASQLKTLHANQQVHGQIAPACVHIDQRGRATLADAVYSSVDDSGVHSASYVAPEQIAGGEATAKSDMFSLGMVLYELLTGELPQRTPTLPSRRVGGVEPALERVVMKCLSTNAGGRPSAAEAGAVLAGASAAWRPAEREDVPQRPHWRLGEFFGKGAFGEAWIAVNQETGEKRVFKFCFEASRLRALQNEVRVFRLLREALADREDIVHVLDYHFDEPPYFIESKHIDGGNLPEWAAARGGLAEVPLPERLELVAQVADALAAAHSLGVLHTDIKPSNVLVSAKEERGEKRWQIHLSDFGLGATLATTPLAEGIPSDAHFYLAPETGKVPHPTLQADIYAVGVMLYQMIIGDFGASLEAGWRENIRDELLAADVADFTEWRPERRLSNAQEVARRLRNLETRRKIRSAERAKHAEAEAALAAFESQSRRLGQYRLVAGLALLAVVVLVVVLLSQ